MIAVSNTSPLTNLAAIGQFGLLHRLFGNICIPEAVWDELNAGDHSWPGRNEVAQSAWVQHHATQNHPLVTALLRDLDRGEAESIALAIELEADLILLDEKEGRRAAQRLGLRVVGVVGVLLQAKTAGLLDRVQPHLDALRQVAGFYLSESVYHHALLLAEEGDSS
ncbi:MAG: DUF3368 domain-containing protein [Anaerolineae bacterium]